MEKIKNLVTVVIPIFNEEFFLSETVESVLNQQYQNVEILLVDDGSTNRSTDIAKDFAAKYPGKIQYLEHENHANKGVCSTRNLGIEHARGEFIAFLDADDVWLPATIGEQVKILKQFPDVAMICDAYLMWYSWNDKYHKDVEIKVASKQDKIYHPPELVFDLYPLSTNHAPGPSNILIRTETVIKYGGFETEFTGIYRLYEDQAFFQKIFLEEKVYISSNCHSKYRQRKGSAVEAVHSGGNYDASRKFFLDWLSRYLSKKNFENPALDELLNRAYHLLERKKQPLISIIALCNKDGDFETGTVESLLNQSYTNWELIVVSNQPLGDPPENIRNLSERFPGKIIYTAGDEQGEKRESVYRNMGLSKAGGDYVAFLENGVVWLPDRLQNLVSLALKYTVAQMICEGFHFTSYENNQKVHKVEPVGVEGDILYNPPSLVYRLQPLGKGNGPVLSSILIENSFLRSIGGFENVFTDQHSLPGEQALLFKVYFHGVVYALSTTGNVDCSSSHHIPNRKISRHENKIFLRWLKKYLAQQDVQYPALEALFRKSWLAVYYPLMYKMSFGLVNRLKAKQNNK